jgi:hypothetical protein
MFEYVFKIFTPRQLISLASKLRLFACYEVSSICFVIQGGPDITCQKNSGSLEGSNKSKKPLFIRSKIMGIN